MSHAAAPSPGARRTVLAEVQALRAVAVGLVIVFHLWPESLPGGYIGVDVFFVISGFLITSHLLRELDATGTVDLPRFWARRIRRLLPAALLVLLATFAAVLLLLPSTAWQRIVVEIAAAAGYVLNWVLAASAVDYFAAENAATPVQHYWSLSVEEQFYAVWPLLLLGLAVVARRRRARVRTWVTGGVAAVVVASLAYSIWFTATTPAAAYFSTLTHGWEFAAGALLALAQPRIASGRWAAALHLRAAAGVVGFVALVVCGLTFTGTTPFPGWLALIPVVATLLVVAAGDSSASALSLGPLLGRRPVQALGDVSYSAYLWHWPPVVIAPVALGGPLGTPAKLAILVATLALAWASKRFVEDPFRLVSRPRPRPSYRPAFAAAVVAAAVMVSGSALVWTGVERSADAAVTSAEDRVETAVAGAASCFGAGAVLSGRECPDPWTVDPDLVLATQPVGPEPGGTTVGGVLPATERGRPDAETTVALVGDSHAAHYMPALRAMAARHDWRIVLVRHNNCSPSAPTWQSPVKADMAPSCQQWRQDLIDHLSRDERIDVVVTSSVAPRYGRLVTTDEGRAQIEDAFTTTWRSWVEAGKKVVVIADVPGTGETVGEAKECVAAAGTPVDPCTSPRTEVVEHDAMAEAARDTPLTDVTLVDWTDMYCGPRECHSVIGGLVVYAGGAHISRLFATSLTPFLEEPIRAALAASPGSPAVVVP